MQWGDAFSTNKCVFLINSPRKDDNARFTTVSIINNVEHIIVFIGFKVFDSDDFYMYFCSRNAQVTFVEKPLVPFSKSRIEPRIPIP